MNYGRANLFARSLAAGSMVAVWTSFNAVSYAGLIFAGPLTVALPYGVMALLLTIVIVSVVVVLGSGLSGMTGSLVSPTLPFYVAAAAALDGYLTSKGVTDPGMRGQAVLLSCAFLTLTSGLALLLVGVARAGGLVRLLPYPVIAGYYLGLGWLFVTGGLSLGSGISLDTAGIAQLFGPAGGQTLACVAAAAAIVLAQRYGHWAAVPGLLLCGGLGFHALRIGMGVSVPAAQNAGWLLGPFPQGGRAALTGAAFDLMDQGALHLLIPYAASAALLSILSIMLWITGNEIDSQRTLHLNRELMLAGAGNMLGAVACGMACGQSYSTTSILRRQRAMNRGAALVPAVVAMIIAFAGSAALGLVPRFVVVSLLISTGLEYLIIRPWRDLPTLLRHEAASVLAIAGIIVWQGMVVGVLAGLGLALVLFAIGYARMPVIRAALPRSACRSTVVWPADAEAALVRLGDAILLCRLQGHVFFLNASEIPATLARLPPGALRQLILDFRDVTGMDSSVHTAFERLKQIGAQQGFRILLCGMRPDVERQFRSRGLLSMPSPGVAEFNTADAALRDAETALLREAGLLPGGAAWQLAEQLSRLRGDAVTEARLAPYLVKAALQAGDYVVRQGDVADSLYFLTEGSVVAQLEQPDGPPLRLYTSGAGMVIGEVGMLCTGIRTASVVTETSASTLVLTAAALEAMERDDPVLATLLHRFLLRELASKLSGSTRLIEMQSL